MASKDKRCRKHGKYHHYDADVHAKPACEKTLSLMDAKLGGMHKTRETNNSGFTVSGRYESRDIVGV